jgi:hypothetical protein
VASTLIAAIFDFLPIFSPFFAPSEWAVANKAKLGRKIRFIGIAFGHVKVCITYKLVMS